LKNYKELEVWQLAKGFAIEVYKLTATFPRSEQFGLTSQIRRAATSVPANIAEGWGRGSAGEYIQFLLIARGSLMEVETHLIIANELGYLTPNQLKSCQSLVERIGEMLNRLVQALRKR
jgi:four helix bundle protein